MIDEEGKPCSSKCIRRKNAIKTTKSGLMLHLKWAAILLGSIYMVLNKKKWMEYSSDSLTKLSEFSKDFNINVIVENHGSLSSNAELLMQVINNVNLKNCGTLPDFGNFCIQRIEEIYMNLLVLKNMTGTRA